MRGDHQHQRQRRQEGAMQQIGKGHVGPQAGNGGEHAGLDREIEDQDVAEKELGAGDRGQRQHIGHPVEQRVAQQRHDHTQGDGKGHGDHRGIGGQEQRVDETFGDQRADPFARDDRIAEISDDGTAEPFEISHEGGLVQPHFLAQGGEVFRCRTLAQNRFGDVAGQQFDHEKDDDRNDQKRDEAKAQTLQDEAENVPHEALPLLLCRGVRGFLGPVRGRCGGPGTPRTATADCTA